MQAFENTKLKTWFLRNKRDLPWRESPTPYAVWVSEVMLQQTQVAVVIPYFERWMDRFPTVRHLAGAPLDDVIKLWEGLGYYSRARNLHEGARYVVDHYQGELPNCEEELEKIKGLGPYTVGAILSFAFHKKQAAVDGNVMRVLARYFLIQEDISKTKTIKKLRLMAQSILPDNESWITNEALIELGATVCQRKPKCIQCPLQGSCLSYSHGMTAQIPCKSPNKDTIALHRSAAVIFYGDQFLVKKVQKGKVMSDLHEFPYFETPPGGLAPEDLQQKIQEQLTLRVKLEPSPSFPQIKHTFTRYRVSLSTACYRCLSFAEVEGYSWLPMPKLMQLAFSSGHRQILNALNLSLSD